MNREHPAGLGLGLRPPSGKLPQSTALLLGAAALLCPSEATSRTPARPVCGGSEAGQKAKEKEALALARRAFPGIPFKVLAYGCRHFGFSPSAPMQVPFAPFELMVQESRVTFRVKESMGLFHGPAHKEFMLLPFQTMAAAEQTARSIREVPMVRHAFGARPLYCTADLDSPGSAAYFACSSLEAPRGAITLDPQGRAPVITLRMITKHPSYARRSLLDGLFETKPAGRKGPQGRAPDSGMARRDQVRDGPRGRRPSEPGGTRRPKSPIRDEPRALIQDEMRLPGRDGQRTQTPDQQTAPAKPEPEKPVQASPLTVHTYSLPWAWLHPEAQAWSEVRMTPEVLAFLALQPGAIVTLQSWHQDYLTLAAPLAPAHNLVIVWNAGRFSGRTAQVIHACRDTKPIDCVHAARGH